MATELKRYVKITRDGSWCIMPLEAAIQEMTTSFNEDEVGEQLVWEIVEMTEEECKALPEFDGW